MRNTLIITAVVILAIALLLWGAAEGIRQERMTDAELDARLDSASIMLLRATETCVHYAVQAGESFAPCFEGKAAMFKHLMEVER